MPPTDEEMRETSYVPENAEDALRAVVLRLCDMHEQKNGARPDVPADEPAYVTAVRLLPTIWDYEQQARINQELAQKVVVLIAHQDRRSLDLDARQAVIRGKEQELLPLKDRLKVARKSLSAMSRNLAAVIAALEPKDPADV